MERREEERKRARQEDIRRTEAKEGMQTRREEPTVTGQKTLQQKEGWNWKRKENNDEICIRESISWEQKHKKL